MQQGIYVETTTRLAFLVGFVVLGACPGWKDPEHHPVYVPQLMLGETLCLVGELFLSMQHSKKSPNFTLVHHLGEFAGNIWFPHLPLNWGKKKDRQICPF